MDLIYHLGVLLEPNPTIRSIYFKLRGYCIFYFLIHVLGIYHIVSVGCSLLQYLFPDVIEVKRIGAAIFWDLCIYLVVCFWKNHKLTNFVCFWLKLG